MKNKRLNQVLIPLVLIIWVLVAMRFLGGCEGPKQLTGPAVGFDLSDLSTGDTLVPFSLLPPYRDPFLDQLPALSKPQREEQPSLQIGSVVPKREPKKLPKLDFLGGVQKKGEAVRGLLNIDGVIHSIHQGDKVGEIEVLSLSLDEVRLQVMDTTMALGKK